MTQPSTYADQAAQFEAVHGFPAPPEQLMTSRPDWPVPFCTECADWHVSADGHSAP